MDPTLDIMISIHDISFPRGKRHRCAVFVLLDLSIIAIPHGWSTPRSRGEWATCHEAEGFFEGIGPVWKIWGLKQSALIGWNRKSKWIGWIHTYRGRCWMTTRIAWKRRHLSHRGSNCFGDSEKTHMPWSITKFQEFNAVMFRKLHKTQISNRLLWRIKIESLNSGRQCWYCAVSSLPLQLGLYLKLERGKAHEDWIDSNGCISGVPVLKFVSCWFHMFVFIWYLYIFHCIYILHHITLYIIIYTCLHKS